MFKSRKVSDINIKCIWPAIIAGAAALGGSALSGLMARSNAKEAGDMSKDVYKHRYRYTVSDMRAAGINPIMAASSGFNVGSGVNYPAAAAPPVPNFSEYIMADAQSSKAIQEVENLKQDIKNKQQQVQESLARTAKERAQAGLITQQEKNALREWSLIDQRITNSIAEYERISSQAALNWRQKESVNETIKQIQQDIEKTKVVLKSLSSVGKAYDGPIGGILGYIKAISDALGLHTSLGGGATTSSVKMIK